MLSDTVHDNKTIYILSHGTWHLVITHLHCSEFFIISSVATLSLRYCGVRSGNLTFTINSGKLITRDSGICLIQHITASNTYTWTRINKQILIFFAVYQFLNWFWQWEWGCQFIMENLQSWKKSISSITQHIKINESKKFLKNKYLLGQYINLIHFFSTTHYLLLTADIQFIPW